MIKMPKELFLHLETVKQGNKKDIQTTVDAYLSNLEDCLLQYASQKTGELVFCFEDAPFHFIYSEENRTLETPKGNGFLNYYWQKPTGFKVSCQGTLYNFESKFFPDVEQQIAKFCSKLEGYKKTIPELLQYLGEK